MIVTDHHLDIQSWQLTTIGEKLYSADAVIDAYLQGKREGLQQHEKVLLQQLKKNIDMAGAHTGKLLQYLGESGILPLSAHLKIQSIDCVKVLVTVSEKDFISDNITDVYDEISAMEQAFSEELYQISFAMTYRGENFNESLLAADGYVLEYKIAAKRNTTHTMLPRIIRVNASGRLL